MKNLSPRSLRSASLFSIALVAIAASTTQAHAASVTTPNIFSNETTASDALYPGFGPSSDAVDGNPKTDLVYNNSSTEDQYLSISGFNATAGIGTLQFFDLPQFSDVRTPLSVTVYYSSTDTSSLLPSDYTSAGNFSLPATDYRFTDGTTTDTDSNGGTINYDQITGLDIPIGTESVLFAFQATADTSDGGYYGTSETQVEGFAAASTPEPSTYALGLIGLGALALVHVMRKHRIV